jgi:hypothetical protein
MFLALSSLSHLPVRSIPKDLIRISLKPLQTLDYLLIWHIPSNTVHATSTLAERLVVWPVLDQHICNLNLDHDRYLL